MVKIILIKSPDEWATTKQVCRDELVVYLSFPPTINIYIYIYVCVWEIVANAVEKNLSDECVSTKLRVTGNHACFI